MAFNFGKPTTPGTGLSFGATSFGSPAPAASTPSFAFGATTPGGPAGGTGGGLSFGSTAFGTTPSAAAPSGGATAPATGFGGGATGFGGGAPGFGGGATAAPGPAGATGTAGGGLSFGATGFGGAGAGAGTGTGLGGFGAGLGTGLGTGTAGGFGGISTPATGFGTPATGFGTPATGFGTPAAAAGTGTGLGTGLGGFGTGTGGFGTGLGGFGTGTTGGFGLGGSTFGQQQQQQQQQLQQSSIFGQPAPQGPPPDPLFQALDSIKASYDPQSPYCKFRFMFYNMVPPSQASQYQKPPNVDSRLWEQAQKDNPDPSCMVPVQAIGFSDLQKRISAQDKQTQVFSKKLQDTKKTLDNIQESHERTAVKIIELKRKHLELTHRVLKIMKMLEVLRCKGYSVMPEEESLRIKLEGLQRELDRPTQFKGRISELFSLTQMLQESEVLQQERVTVVDQKSIQTINKVLAEQQQGLSHLVSIIKQDLKDAEIMSKGYRERRIVQK